MNYLNKIMLRFKTQHLGLVQNSGKRSFNISVLVNPLRTSAYILLSTIFFLTSSSLLAQNDTTGIQLNSRDLISIDSMLNTINTEKLDSAAAFHFWQSAQDSISSFESLSSVFKTADSTLKHLNDDLNPDLQNPEGVSNYIALFQNKVSSGEKSLFGIDIRTNIPVAIASIPNSFYIVDNTNLLTASQGDGLNDSVSTQVSKPISLGFGFKYYINNSLAITLAFDKGSLTGMQNNVNTSVLNNVSDYKSFINNFKSYGISMELNPVGLMMKNENPASLKPWITMGFGYVVSDVKAYRCDGRIKSYQFNCFATTVGLKFSYALTPSIDITCSSTLYILETAYLDGIHVDNKNTDKMLLNAVGITYKINSASNRNSLFR